MASSMEKVMRESRLDTVLHIVPPLPTPLVSARITGETDSDAVVGALLHILSFIQYIITGGVP